MKGNKGITLIALVITIIVLIILAAVTLATLTGENGILNRAQDASRRTAVAEAKDQINISLSSLKSEVMAKLYTENTSVETMVTSGIIKNANTDDVRNLISLPTTKSNGSAYDYAVSVSGGTVTITRTLTVSGQSYTVTGSINFGTSGNYTTGTITAATSNPAI